MVSTTSPETLSDSMELPHSRKKLSKMKVIHASIFPLINGSLRRIRNNSLRIFSIIFYSKSIRKKPTLRSCRSRLKLLRMCKKEGEGYWSSKESKDHRLPKSTTKLGKLLRSLTKRMIDRSLNNDIYFNYQRLISL